jgi:hypothetical protein
MRVSKRDDFLKLSLDLPQLLGTFLDNFSSFQIEHGRDLLLKGRHVKGVVLLYLEGKFLFFKRNVLFC